MHARRIVGPFGCDLKGPREVQKDGTFLTINYQLASRILASVPAERTNTDDLAVARGTNIETLAGVGLNTSTLLCGLRSVNRSDSV